MNFFCHQQKFFLSKNIFKVALQYLFNGFILFKTVFNLKLLKIDPKCVFLKTWKKFGKPGKYIEKMSGNSVKFLNVNSKGVDVLKKNKKYIYFLHRSNCNDF